MSDYEWRPEGGSWDDASDLWEHQGEELTIGRLADLLAHLDPTLPIRVMVYDGSERRAAFAPVEITYVGTGERPDALDILVASIERP